MNDSGTISSSPPVDISESESESESRMDQSQSAGSSPVGSPLELDKSMSLTSSCGGYSEIDTDIVSSSSLQSSISTDDTNPNLALNRISQVGTLVEVPEMISSTDSMGSKVTLYKISLESNDICFHLPSSCVWRTYSEFVWLKRRLDSNRSLIGRTLPDLPSRNLLNLFDKDFAEKRRVGLQEFLTKMVEDRSCLSDSAVHLFLQSELSTNEIQAWLERKLDNTVLELIRRGKELFTEDHNASIKAV